MKTIVTPGTVDRDAFIGAKAHILLEGDLSTGGNPAKGQIPISLNLGCGENLPSSSHFPAIHEMPLIISGRKLDDRKYESQLLLKCVCHY